MQIVLDMGDHARFVWPAYAAFAVIFGALIAWILRSNADARARLEKLEAERPRK